MSKSERKRGGAGEVALETMAISVERLEGMMVRVGAGGVQGVRNATYQGAVELAKREAEAFNRRRLVRAGNHESVRAVMVRGDMGMGMAEMQQLCDGVVRLIKGRCVHSKVIKT